MLEIEGFKKKRKLRINGLLPRMTTLAAIDHIIKKEQLSMYAIAKRLDTSSIMIAHYRYGRHVMGFAIAERVEDIFGIVVTDAKGPGRSSK